MKKMLFLYTALIGLATCAPSAADEGFYAGILGGANWVNRSGHSHGNHKAGYLVGADFGYSWCNDISIEGEFLYRHNCLHGVKWKRERKERDNCAKGRDYCGRDKKGNGNLKSYALMANLRYDLPIDMCFTPYVLGGIGWAKSRFHASGKRWDFEKACHNKCNRRNSKNGFAYQFGAGVSFPFYCGLILDLGYRFMRAQKEINNNSFVAALKYRF